jgi:tRNA A-37 threonylcarbamoyl transferase component Bud32
MTTPIAGSTGTTSPSLQLLSESELVRTVLAEDYEILEELGRGGMAIVYRAREKALDREVAIKVLPARLVVDKEFVGRFEHEARTAAKLEHPNIVPIYRVGTAGPNGEVIYFVMKLLRGQSLSAVLKERRKLDASDVRKILMETASALGYAAKRNVVHRDIKPDNIMLDSEGRCVITDFGIAKSPGGQQTAAGTSLGTPRYMSPEHAMGLPLDGRSDMYSLGIVAYQCLAGKTPFDAEDPFAVLYKHINDTLPEPALAGDEEKQVYAVIERMLEKNPNDRFQSANELIAALGGEVSAPTLVAASRTSVGMMAPTERIPTPLPWYSPVLTRVAQTDRRLWIAAGGLAAVMVIALLLRAGSKPRAADQIASSTASRDAAPPAQAKQVPPSPVALDSGKPRDTAAVEQAAKTPPKPTMSDRAAAILAYNKLRSACPKLKDTLSTTKPLEYAVRVDSMRDRVVSDKMDVIYDVCGLSKGSPFTTDLTLIKLNQGGIPRFRQKDHAEQQIETAGSPRSRQRATLDSHEMSAGDYELKVVVTDSKKRLVTTSRFFKIADKQH